jgi:hypothetical protein
MLLKYVQSDMKSQKGITMKMVLDMFIEKCVKQDLYDPYWEEKLVKAEEVINSYASLDDGCHKLAFGTDESGHGVYSCIGYNEEGVVRIKNLGKTESLMASRCHACGKDREVKAGLRDRDNRIRELEEKIQMKAVRSNKVPICNKGAILVDEGSSFKSCPKSSVPVSVAGYCKKLSGGLPCALYSEIAIPEGPL